jgi:hypothetical protein
MGGEIEERVCRFCDGPLCLERDKRQPKGFVTYLFYRCLQCDLTTIRPLTLQPPSVPGPIADIRDDPYGDFV